jgi:hypothetical protein
MCDAGPSSERRLKSFTAPPQFMQRNSVSLSSNATAIAFTFQNGS